MSHYKSTPDGLVPFTPEEELEWEAMLVNGNADVLRRQAAEVRSDRNQRLASSDWTQLPNAPADSAAWAAYRQALRDIPAQPGFPADVVWPAQPE